MPRYSLICHYCNKKYPSATQLIVHLGIRENTYTWPTCTCPIKPGSVNNAESWGYIHGELAPDRKPLTEYAKARAREEMHGGRSRETASNLAAEHEAPEKRMHFVPNARPKRTINAEHTSSKKEKDQHIRALDKYFWNCAGQTRVGRNPTNRRKRKACADKAWRNRNICYAIDHYTHESKTYSAWHMRRVKNKRWKHANQHMARKYTTQWRNNTTKRMTYKARTPL